MFSFVPASVLLVSLVSCNLLLSGIVTADRDHDLNPNSKVKNAKIFPKAVVEDAQYWYDEAAAELAVSLNTQLNTNVAQNVIFFLGDGMSIPTLTASRIYKGQQKGQSGEEYKLVWEDFPDLGVIKTYAVDKQVADSASTATAYLCGSKANYGTVGVDATVPRYNCEDMNAHNKLDSIGQWALDSGRRAGLVTNTRLTHATPSGLYARSASRGWECDEDISSSTSSKCPDLKDIAMQLIEDSPGKDFNVIMGGGYQGFNGNAYPRPDDPLHNDCTRRDGRNLFQEWQDNQQIKNRKHAAVRLGSELKATDYKSVDYLMGIFSNGHMPFAYEARESNIDVPTLAEMTEAAISVLQNGGDQGYFLLVEGGKIDLAHHGNQFNAALDETSGLDDAVLKALSMVDLSNTLIVVTSDHSHVTTMNGYPERGQDITGIASLGDDDLPYATLMYANGPGYTGTYRVSSDGNSVVRRDITHDNVGKMSYHKAAGVPRGSDTHGGDDVLVFATGAMSHLFQRTHEQSYIAHAMAYASCIGANKDHCKI